METNEVKKDLPNASPGQQHRGLEGENPSTTTDETSKNVGDLQETVGANFDSSEEKDLDDVVHSKNAIQQGDNRGGQDTSLSQQSTFAPDDIGS